MNDYSNNFSFDPNLVQVHHFYIFFVVALALTIYLITKSKTKYKFELFFLSFFLITGNTNDILTIKIPGFSFFELQPERLLFFMLSFFIARKMWSSGGRLELSVNKKVPWFIVVIFVYVIWLILSQIVNISDVGVVDVLKNSLDAIAFLVILIAIGLMADKPSYDLIGKSIIIGAVFSSLVSFLQIAVDPYFLRIGDDRLAFGSILRANGIFATEYFNSYYLIIAITWVLISLKNKTLKISLILLFSLGVLSSFQRMSWLILVLVLVTYSVYIKRIAIEKLLLGGLAFLALFLSLSIFFYQDIMNSTLVKERLSERVDGREGYYAMVIDNISKRPVFGYGDLQNEVYYTNMLRITGNRKRATGEEGDLHSGYFSSLFLYGIPALVFFIVFVLLSVLYYSRAFNHNMYFVIPFLVSILYLVGNLTNTFLFLKYISLLYALHIGIGIGFNKIREQKLLKAD